jgi:predicted dehydrogenase
VEYDPAFGGTVVTTSSLTVGIVGLGYGRAHIPAFQAHGVRVVALCQRDQVGAQAIARRYDVPHVFHRWEEMLEVARPGIVVIAPPPHLHHTIALAALEAGAHVLCEKPLAMTVSEARAMAAAAARARRIAMTSFNWRFPAAMRELHARVRKGAVGRVFHVSARWRGGRMASPDEAPNWRMDRAQAGHGVMGDQGVHVVDLIRSTLGEFRRVAANAGIAYPERPATEDRLTDAEDHCAVLAQLVDGTHVAFDVSRVAHGVTEQALDVFGSLGTLSYRHRRAGVGWWDGTLMASEGGGPLRPVRPHEAPALPAGDDSDPLDIVGRATIAPLVARFLESIESGVTASPSFADGVRAQIVLDAVLESAARRAWVDVASS